MDAERARTLLEAEQSRLREQISQLSAAEEDDRMGADEPGDAGDRGQQLTAQATDALVHDQLAHRLGVVKRALGRLDGGSYGISVRSGRPIPDDRLEADPAAELTVEEARAAERR